MNRLKNGIEILLRLERTDCETTNYIFANFTGTSIERLKIDGKETTHKITFKSNQDAESALNHLKLITSDTIKTGDKTLWAKAACCSSCSVVGAFDCVILNSKAINQQTMSYKLLLPNYAKLREFKEKLEENDIKYVISDISVDSNNLTPRETEIIIKLYENGYFNPERKMNLTEIAGEMHISTSALSEILRKSMRKIVRDFIENKL